MKIMTALAGIRSGYVKSLKRKRTGLPKSIRDHVARDIGMTRNELEQHRFTWPSESSDRPPL